MPEPGFTPKARQDLNDIWDFTVERWDAAQADRYVVAIVRACQDLAADRLVGCEANVIRRGYLSHRVGANVVFFRRDSGDDGEAIEIVRILHERMDPARHIP